MIAYDRGLMAAVTERSIHRGADRGPPLYIISIVFVIVAGLFVFGRIFTRLSTSSLGADDHCLIASLLFSIGLSITEIQAVKNGYGKHIDELSASQIHEALRWVYFAQVMYKIVITFNKMSLLFFYLRIFKSPLFRKICFAGLFVVGGSGLAFVIATIFQCIPISFYWNRNLSSGYCLLPGAFWLSYAVLNVVTNFFILGLPLPALYRLPLLLRDKIGLLAVFCLGGFVCFTTIIRMTTLVSLGSGKDFTYGPVRATNWTVVEANTGLICACLPIYNTHLAKLLRLLPGGPSQFDHSSSKYGFGSGGAHLGSSSDGCGVCLRLEASKMDKKSAMRDQKHDRGVRQLSTLWGPVDTNATTCSYSKATEGEALVLKIGEIRTTTDITMHISEACLKIKEKPGKERLPSV